MPKIWAQTVQTSNVVMKMAIISICYFRHFIWYWYMGGYSLLRQSTSDWSPCSPGIRKRFWKSTVQKTLIARTGAYYYILRITFHKSALNPTLHCTLKILSQKTSLYTNILKYYQILSNIIKYCQILSNIIIYYQIFSNIIKYCPILSNIIKYSLVQIQM